MLEWCQLGGAIPRFEPTPRVGWVGDELRAAGLTTNRRLGVALKDATGPTDLGSDSGRRAGIPTPSTHKLATTTIAQGCTRHFLACNSDWHFTGSLCGAAGVSFIGSSGGNGVTIGFFTSKLDSQCQVFPDLHSEYLHIRMLQIG